MDYEVVGEILKIPLLDIYVDSSFNCRGFFDHLSVHDLGRSIKKTGLMVPLIIQPIEDTPAHQRPSPCPWVFRLVAGHRRFMAVDIWTDATEIECCVRYGLSEEAAHNLNYLENLQRHDLNILQEARFLHARWPDALVAEIKQHTQQSKGWIQVRQKLMKLPEEVQAAASYGTLSQFDITELAKLPPDEVVPAFRQISRTKSKVGQRAIVQQQKWRQKRVRGKKEIERMVTSLFTDQVYTSLTDRELHLVQSALVWAHRGIDTQDFLVERLDIPEECVIIDVEDKYVQLKSE